MIRGGWGWGGGFFIFLCIDRNGRFQVYLIHVPAPRNFLFYSRCPPSTITGYKYMQDYLHSTYNAYVRGRGCGFLAVWIYLWYVKSYISLLLWLKNFGPCKVTTLIIEVNMYIEDNAADKKEKVGEEGKINPFMNIVDWEKLVKYLSTIECERDNDRGRDRFPNEKCLSPFCTLSSSRVHSIRLKRI